MVKTIAFITSIALLSLAQMGPVKAVEPFQIDAILSLTGPGSFIGHDTSLGLSAMEQVVNQGGGIGGRPIKIVFHDDQTNPQISVQLFNEIAASHRAVLLGPSIAATCGAVTPLLKDVLAYCFSPGIHPPRGSLMFSPSTESSDQFIATLTYAARRGLTRIAVITSSDASGQDAERGIAAAADIVKGVTLVDREHFAPADISVAAQVARIKASNAQLLLGWATGTPFGTILRAVSDAGLAIPVVTSAGNMSITQLQQYGDIVPTELIFPSTIGSTPDMVTERQAKNTITAFDRALARLGVSKPSYINLVVVDPLMVVIDALRKLGTDATAEQLRDFISSQRGWRGLDGTYDYVSHPQRGLGVESVVMTRWVAVANRWDAVSVPGGIPIGK